jgi:hypothetical protein
MVVGMLISTSPWCRWHAPAHHRQFALGPRVERHAGRPGIGGRLPIHIRCSVKLVAQIID